MGDRGDEQRQTNMDPRGMRRYSEGMNEDDGWNLIGKDI